MQLRALIGSRAGEIRDYSPLAARGALASGTAARVDEVSSALAVAHAVIDEIHVHQTTAVWDAISAQLHDKPKTHARRKG